MPAALVSLALSGFGRDALKCAAGLAAALVLAIALALAGLLSALHTAATVLLGPAGTVGAVGVTGTAPKPAAGSALSSAGEERETAAVAYARTHLGRPYVWGGASPQTGFDCSGLVQWAYGQAGARLPRTAQQQFDATPRLTPEHLRPGDLLFFARTYDTGNPREWITHVGIYVGNGRMVNAQSDGIQELPAFEGYWGAHYAGAGRVGHVGGSHGERAGGES